MKVCKLEVLTNIGKLKLAKILSGIVVFVWLVGILGWIFGIEWMTEIISGAGQVRLLAMISFVACGIILYSIIKNSEWKNKDSLFYLLALLSGLFLLIFVILTSVLQGIGIDFHLENFVSKVFSENLHDFIGSVPSLFALGGFVLVVFAGISSIINFRRAIKIIGIVVALIGLTALLGYVIKNPLMYFDIAEISNAMTVHVAVLFVLLGAGLALVGCCKPNLQRKEIEHFNSKYSIKQKIVILVVSSLGVTLMLAFFNIILVDNISNDTIILRDIDGPLQIMTEQVIAYDSTLTENIYWALVDAIDNESDEVKERKEVYEDAWAKLDKLLKEDARALLEKSQRTKADIILSESYLDEMDKANLKLGDLGIRTFEAMEKGDLKGAFELAHGDDYYKYKAEFDVFYNKWVEMEAKHREDYYAMSIFVSGSILKMDIIFSLAVIFLSIIISLRIYRSIINPLKELEGVANKISSGNIDVKISSDLKKTNGVIGILATTYDKLLESSHLSLSKFVEAKVATNGRIQKLSVNRKK